MACALRLVMLPQKNLAGSKKAVLSKSPKRREGYETLYDSFAVCRHPIHSL